MRTDNNFKTIIARSQQIYLENKSAVIAALEMDVLTYNLMEYEEGLKFLESHFPHGSDFEQYNHLYARCPKFWQWFRAERSIWEHDLIQYFEIHKVQFSKQFYQMDFHRKTNQERLTSSFQHQYLKYLQHA
jgi:hypothetical protein